MSLQRTLVGAGLGLVAAGAVATAVWVSGEPPDPPPVVIRSDAPVTPPDRPADPVAPRVRPSEPVETAPLGPTELSAILERLDRVWDQTKGLQGDAYYRAIGRRDVQVEDLVLEVAALGPEVVPEAGLRMYGEGSTYPRQLLLMRSLSAIGSEDALRLLADMAVARAAWKVRDFAWRQLVTSHSESTLIVVREFLPSLKDPRFLLPVLQSDWPADVVEDSYRAWLGKAGTDDRNKSYSFVVRVEGAWLDDLLREVASSSKPGPERAGSINALAVRKSEGCLAFFRDLLWVEEDNTVIKALIRAIVRVGDEEGRSILAEYAEVGAPDELREFAMRAVRAPKPIPAGRGEGGGPVLHGVRRKDADPEKGQIPR